VFPQPDTLRAGWEAVGLDVQPGFVQNKGLPKTQTGLAKEVPRLAVDLRFTVMNQAEMPSVPLNLKVVM
jgi:hypothetical protein